MKPSPAADDTRGPARRGDRGHPSAPAPTTASGARDRVSALLQCAGVSLDTVTAADALLVTSELVTNAIRHGGGVTAFHADIADDALYLSVSDGHPRFPYPRTAVPGHPGGYGWPLIQRLTERVDVSSHSGGKTVAVVLRLL
ncbi:ATP-binding protein [Streptomyces sp. NPDC058655]|uniref:ATP-binding protein n=1 Tax=unclassified Streptomyces TaxID=2593676 RepID=UPI0036500F60